MLLVMWVVFAEISEPLDFPTLTLICRNDASVVARYTGFELHSKCEGETFIDSIRMSFCAGDIRNETRELMFTAPISPGAKIIGYGVCIGEDFYRSVVYPKCVGQQVYDTTKADETCAKAEIKQDVFKVCIKINEKTITGVKIVFCVQWHRTLVQNFHIKEGLCYEYVFSIKSYFKCGELFDRRTSNYVENQYGLADPNIEIDLSGCYYEILDVPDNFTRKDAEGLYSINIQKRKSHDNIRFTFVDRRDGNIFNAALFNFDGYKVLGLTLKSEISSVLTALDATREIIFVIDRSGSMGFLTDGVIPYKILNSALGHILSACSDSNIFFNLVVFNHSSGRESKLFSSSVKLFTKGFPRQRGSIADFVSSVEDVKKRITETNMLFPDGGTNILDGLKNACNLPRIRCSSNGIVMRNIILLTDGGDSNLESIIGLVRMETETKGTRFFSVGIGNGVSFDTIEAVGDAGNGTSTYIWDLKDLDSKFAEIVKATGIRSKKFKWLSSPKKISLLHCIKEGFLSLDEETESLTLPNYDIHQEIFPTTSKTMFWIFKINKIPNEVDFSLDGKPIKINLDAISCLSGQSEEMMQREIGTLITEILNTEIHKRISSSLDNSRISCPVYSKWNWLNTSEKTKRLLNYLESFGIMKYYTEKVDFDVKHALLTKDTLLMAGDRIMENVDWRGTIGIEKMLVNQLIKCIDEDVRSKAQRPNPSYFSSGQIVTDGPSRSHAVENPDQEVDFSESSEYRSSSISHIQKDFFYAITNIQESSNDFNSACRNLTVYFENFVNHSLEKLRKIIQEVMNMNLSDASKKLHLNNVINAAFFPQPDKAQALCMIAKRKLASNIPELAEYYHS